MPAVAPFPSVKDLSIPQSLGTLTSSVAGNSDKTILLIQDAHDSLEAQEHIAKLIHHFVEQYGVRTVYEEGDQGKVGTDFYLKRIKDPRIREAVAYYLMDELRLSAAEYAHVTRLKEFRLMGADDSKLYEANLEAYKQHAKIQKEVAQELTELEQDLRGLASKVFSKPLQNLMKKQESFESGRISIMEYIKELLKLSREQKSTVGAALVAALEGQAQGLPLPSAEVFLAELTQLEKRALEQLIRKSNSHRVSDSHSTTVTVTLVYHTLHMVRLCQKLNRLELSEEEYQRFRQDVQNYRTQKMADLIAQGTGRSVAYLKRWETGLRHAREFYETALQRDQAVDKSLRNFKCSSESTAIFVFGGFHRKGIEKLFKNHGVSYAVITPKISKQSKWHQKKYKELMSDDRRGGPRGRPQRAGARPAPTDGLRPESVLRQWYQKPLFRASREISHLENAARTVLAHRPEENWTAQMRQAVLRVTGTLVPVTLPWSRSEIRQILGNEKRIMTMTDDVDQLDWILWHRAKQDPQKYVRVRLKDALEILRSKVSLTVAPGQKEIRDLGPLKKIIRDGGIVLLDATDADPKEVEAFNSLFDDDAFFEDIKAHPDLEVFVAMPPAQMGDYANTLYSRSLVISKNEILAVGDESGAPKYEDPINKIETLNFAANTESDSHINSMTVTESVVVDLMQVPFFREILLGKASVRRNAAGREESFFAGNGEEFMGWPHGVIEKAIQENKPLVIRGGRWTDPAFTALLRDILNRGYATINGRNLPLPPNFKIIRQDVDYKNGTEDKKLLRPGALAADQGPLWVINDTNEKQFFSNIRIEDGVRQEIPGILQSANARIRIVGDLEEGIWHAILHSPNVSAIEVDPSVEIPAMYQDLLDESVGAPLAGALRAGTSPAPTYKVSIYEGYDADYLLENVHQSGDARKKGIEVITVTPGMTAARILERISYHSPSPSVIASPLPPPALRADRPGGKAGAKSATKTSADPPIFSGGQSPSSEIATALHRISGGPRDDIKNEGRLYQVEEMQMVKALREGKVVLLHQIEHNRKLMDSLAGIFTEDPYLVINGERAALSTFPGKLILSRTRREGSPNWHPNSLTLEPDNPAEDYAAILKGEFKFDRFDTEFERVLNLLNTFQSIPADINRRDAKGRRFYIGKPLITLAKLRILFQLRQEFGNWLDAFEYGLLMGYYKDPEVAAYMRVQVRLQFLQDQKDRNTKVIDEVRLNEVLNKVRDDREWEKYFWQFHDALGLNLLMQLGMDKEIESFGDNQSDKGFEMIKRALIKHAAKAKRSADAQFTLEDFYRARFRMESVDVEKAPEIAAQKLTGWRDINQRVSIIARIVKAVRLVMLVGAPGTGKTYSFDHIAQAIGFPAFEPFTTGAKVSESDLLIKQLETGDSSVDEKGTVQKWIEADEGLLLWDEANLTENPEFHRILQDDLNKKKKKKAAVFAGNDEATEGRKMPGLVRDSGVLIPFEAMEEAVLYELVSGYLSKSISDSHSSAVTVTLKDLTNWILELHSLFYQMNPDYEFSIREIQEVVNRIVTFLGKDLKREDVVFQAWLVYRDRFTADEQGALKVLLNFKYSRREDAFSEAQDFDLEEMEAERRDKVLKKIEGRYPGVALVGETVEFIANILEILEMRKKRMAPGGLPTPGKSSVLIIGPSGWGKDDILLKVLEAEGIHDYHKLSGAMNFKNLKDAVEKAGPEGSIVILREMDFIQTGILEGELNDVVTGASSPGFLFFGTMNGSKFSGRKKVASPLFSRSNVILPQPHRGERISHIAQIYRESNALNIPDEAFNELVAFHQWIEVQIQDTPQWMPTTREIFRALRFLNDDPQKDWRKAAQASYGPVFGQWLLKDKGFADRLESGRIEGELTVPDTSFERVYQRLVDLLVPPGMRPIKIAINQQNRKSYYDPESRQIIISTEILENPFQTRIFLFQTLADIRYSRKEFTSGKERMEAASQDFFKFLERGMTEEEAMGLDFNSVGTESLTGMFQEFWTLKSLERAYPGIEADALTSAEKLILEAAGNDPQKQFEAVATLMTAYQNNQIDGRRLLLLALSLHAKKKLGNTLEEAVEKLHVLGNKFPEWVFDEEKNPFLLIESKHLKIVKLIVANKAVEEKEEHIKFRQWKVGQLTNPRSELGKLYLEIPPRQKPPKEERVVPSLLEVRQAMGQAQPQDEMARMRDQKMERLAARIEAELKKMESQLDNPRLILTDRRLDEIEAQLTDLKHRMSVRAWIDDLKRTILKDSEEWNRRVEDFEQRVQTILEKVEIERDLIQRSGEDVEAFSELFDSLLPPGMGDQMGDLLSDLFGGGSSQPQEFVDAEYEQGDALPDFFDGDPVDTTRLVVVEPDQPIKSANPDLIIEIQAPAKEKEDPNFKKIRSRFRDLLRRKADVFYRIFSEAGIVPGPEGDIDMEQWLATGSSEQSRRSFGGVPKKTPKDIVITAGDDLTEFQEEIFEFIFELGFEIWVLTIDKEKIPVHTLGELRGALVLARKAKDPDISDANMVKMLQATGFRDPMPLTVEELQAKVQSAYVFGAIKLAEAGELEDAEKPGAAEASKPFEFSKNPFEKEMNDILKGPLNPRQNSTVFLLQNVRDEYLELTLMDPKLTVEQWEQLSQFPHLTRVQIAYSSSTPEVHVIDGLQHMQQLQSLSIKSVKISLQLLIKMGNFKNLEELKLENVYMGDMVSERAAKLFAELPALENIEIKQSDTSLDHYLSNTFEILAEDMLGTIRFVVDGNEKFIIPKERKEKMGEGMVREYTLLSIENIQLKMPKGISKGNMGKGHSLDFSNQKRADVKKWLSQLSGRDLGYLTELNLSNTGLTSKDLFEVDLFRFESLRKLNLSDNPEIDDYAMNEISHLTQLRELNLSGTNVEYLPHIANLKRLKIIRLTHTIGNLSELLLNALAEMPRLATILGPMGMPMEAKNLDNFASREQRRQYQIEAESSLVAKGSHMFPGWDATEEGLVIYIEENSEEDVLKAADYLADLNLKWLRYLHVNHPPGTKRLDVTKLSNLLRDKFLNLKSLRINGKEQIGPQVEAAVAAAPPSAPIEISGDPLEEERDGILEILSSFNPSEYAVKNIRDDYLRLSFTDTLPTPEQWEALSHFPYLTHILIEGNANKHDLKGLRHLQQLASLSIQSAEITHRAIEEMRQLKKLETLELGHIEMDETIRGIFGEGLLGLPALENLKITNSNVLPVSSVLNAMFIPISEDWPSAIRFEIDGTVEYRISLLREGDTQKGSDEMGKVINYLSKEGIPRIKGGIQPDYSLDFSNQKRDAVLKRLKGLAELDLKFLTELDLSNIGITSADLLKIQLRKFPLLRKLNLSGNPGVDDAAFVEISRLTQLRELDLSGTSAQYLPHISKLKRLRRIDLSGISNFKGGAMGALAELPNITSITLPSRNQMKARPGSEVFTSAKERRQYRAEAEQALFLAASEIVGPQLLVKESRNGAYLEMVFTKEFQDVFNEQFFREVAALNLQELKRLVIQGVTGVDVDTIRASLPHLKSILIDGQEKIGSAESPTSMSSPAADQKAISDEAKMLSAKLIAATLIPHTGFEIRLPVDPASGYTLNLLPVTLSGSVDPEDIRIFFQNIIYLLSTLDLKYLTGINLSKLDFIATVPGLSKLKTLRKVNLSGNAKINDLVMAEISKLPHLEELDLSGTGVEWLPHVTHLTKLRKIILYDTNQLKQKEGVVQALFSMGDELEIKLGLVLAEKDLKFQSDDERELYESRAENSLLRAWKGSRSVWVPGQGEGVGIVFDANQISKELFESLAFLDLKHLEHLRIRKTTLEVIMLEGLSLLQSLKFITIDDPMTLSSANIEELKKLPHLWSLMIAGKEEIVALTAPLFEPPIAIEDSDSPERAEEVKRITELLERRFGLGRELFQIMYVDKLHYIGYSLELSNLQASSIEEIVEALAGLPLKYLTGLDLSSNELLTATVPNLSKLQSLRSLNLGGNPKINDLVFAELTKLSNLEELDLSGTGVEWLPHINRLQKLKRLELGHSMEVGLNAIRALSEMSGSLEYVSLPRITDIETVLIQPGTIESNFGKISIRPMISIDFAAHEFMAEHALLDAWVKNGHSKIASVHINAKWPGELEVALDGRHLSRELFASLAALDSTFLKHLHITKSGSGQLLLPKGISRLQNLESIVIENAMDEIVFEDIEEIGRLPHLKSITTAGEEMFDFFRSPKAATAPQTPPTASRTLDKEMKAVWNEIKTWGEEFVKRGPSDILRSDRDTFYDLEFSGAPLNDYHILRLSQLGLQYLRGVSVANTDVHYLPRIDEISSLQVINIEGSQVDDQAVEYLLSKVPVIGAEQHQALLPALGSDEIEDYKRDAEVSAVRSIFSRDQLEIIKSPGRFDFGYGLHFLVPRDKKIEEKINQMQLRYVKGIIFASEPAAVPSRTLEEERNLIHKKIDEFILSGELSSRKRLVSTNEMIFTSDDRESLVLNLDDTNITEEQFAALAALNPEFVRTIYISHTKIQTLPSLDEFKNLKILKAYHSELTDIAVQQISLAKRLEMVNLGHNQRITNVALLSGLPHLEHLYLSENPNIEVVGIQELAGMQTLKELDLRGTAINFDEIAVPETGNEEVFIHTSIGTSTSGRNGKLKPLRKITLEAEQRIIAGVLANFSKNRGLEWVGHPGYFTDAQAKENFIKFDQGNNRLVLDISDLNLTDELFESIAALRPRFVETIWAAKKYPKVRQLFGITLFQNLKELNIDGLPIEDAAIDEIRRVRTLKALSLANSPTIKNIALLAALPKLGNLYLDGTEVTAEDVRALAGMKSLGTIYLEGTAIKSFNEIGRSPANSNEKTVKVNLNGGEFKIVLNPLTEAELKGEEAAATAPAEPERELTPHEFVEKLMDMLVGDKNAAMREVLIQYRATGDVNKLLEGAYGHYFKDLEARSELRKTESARHHGAWHFNPFSLMQKSGPQTMVMAEAFYNQLSEEQRLEYRKLLARHAQLRIVFTSTVIASALTPPALRPDRPGGKSGAKQSSTVKSEIATPAKERRARDDERVQITTAAELENEFGMQRVSRVQATRDQWLAQPKLRRGEGVIVIDRVGLSGSRVTGTTVPVTAPILRAEYLRDEIGVPTAAILALAQGTTAYAVINQNTAPAFFDSAVTYLANLILGQRRTQLSA